MNLKTIRAMFIKMMILALALVLAGQASNLPASAAGGEDDGMLVGGFGQGFGPDGSGTVELRFEALFYNAVAVQPDGKIVVVGSGPNGRFGWLGRLDPDGRLDPVFGIQGQIIDSNTSFNDVAIQPDYKIVAVGSTNNDFAVARFLPNGVPDTDFNRSGLAILDFDGGFDSVGAVVIQSDGKIVVGGDARNCGPINCFDADFGLARFNPNGTPDRSFDGDAKHAFGLGADFEGVNTLVLEPDGRIVAIGDTDRDDGARIAMARFLPDGRFDNTLDGDGKFISNFTFEGDNEAVQPDGKIIVAFQDIIGVNQQMHLVRFQANGQVDSSFGNNGSVSLPPGPVAPRDFIGNVLRLPDGNLLFAGNTGPNGDLVVANLTPEGQPNPIFGNGLGYIILSFGANEAVIDLAVAPSGHILLLHRADGGYYLTRLLSNGRLDKGGGRALTDLGDRNDKIHDIAIQPDGKIVVTGERGTRLNNRLTSELAVARYTADGRLDTGFAGDGIVTDLEVPSVGRAVAFDAQGRILVAGQVDVGASSPDMAWLLRRYQPNGDPAQFPAAPGGQVVFNPTGVLDDVAELAVQPDGKIVLAGRAGFTNPPADFALARYLDNGQPDPTFGSGGFVLTDFDGQNSTDFASALALLPDGKLLLAGSTSPKTGQGGTVLLRYLPNGAPDPAFGGGDGKLSLPRGVAALALQPDGKIVTGGTVSINGKRVFVAARYTPDGAPDPTFNASGDAIASFEPEVAAADMVLEPDGGIVITGCTIERVDRFALARFLPNGQPDTNFSGDGKALFDMNSVENGCAHALARDPASGDYLLAGFSDLRLVDAQFALARVKGFGQVNNRPQAAPNQYTTALNTPLTIAAPGVLGNDSDAEGQPLTSNLINPTSNGQLTLNSAGGFTYTPNPGFSGVDSFTYWAGDGFNKSNPTIVTITVGEAEPNPDPDPNPNPGGFSVFLPIVVK